MKRFLLAFALALGVTCAVVAWRRGCCRGAWEGGECSCGQEHTEA